MFMEKLFTIGQVSKMLKVTARSVRFYQEIGLLTPTKTTEETKYRYYSEANITQLKKILYLKELGLSLDDIKSYFSYSTEDKIKILKTQQEKFDSVSDLIKNLLDYKDYNLDSIDNLTLLGSKIQKKELAKLEGVWKLSGIYHGINDATTGQNPITKFSPYQFLAFDKNGTSPWFYFANNQKIVFNTFNKPTSEIYQIKDDKLYLQISNYNEHIFCLCEESEYILNPHVLVFNKVSNTFDDFKQYLFVDKKPKGKISNESIGLWNHVGTNDRFTSKNLAETKSDNVLIIENTGNAKYLSNNKTTTFTVTSDIMFNEDLSLSCKFKIEGDLLILENKTKTYSFTGKLKRYLIFKRNTLLTY